MGEKRDEIYFSIWFQILLKVNHLCSWVRPTTGLNNFNPGGRGLWRKHYSAQLMGGTHDGPVHGGWERGGSGVTLDQMVVNYNKVSHKWEILIKSSECNFQVLTCISP